MKRIKSFIFPALVLALLCIGAESDSARPKFHRAPHMLGGVVSGAEWSVLLNPPITDAERDIVTDTDWAILPRADIYEVGASKLDWTIIQKLPEAGFIKLREPQAQGFLGTYYKCPGGKTPYLARAVYAKGGFGRFRAERKGNSLAVVWGQAGPYREIKPDDYAESAVIVNLDFTPEEVYTELSGAW